MKEGTLKIWHMIVALAVQLIVGGMFAGSISADVKAHERQISVNAADIKRMDNEGPAVWRTSVRFSDKEADQMKRELEALRAELQSQRAILVRIEAQGRN